MAKKLKKGSKIEAEVKKKESEVRTESRRKWSGKGSRKGSTCHDHMRRILTLTMISSHNLDNETPAPSYATYRDVMRNIVDVGQSVAQSHPGPVQIKHSSLGLDPV